MPVKTNRLTAREMWDTYSLRRLSTERAREAARRIFTAEYHVEIVAGCRTDNGRFYEVACLAWNDPGLATFPRPDLRYRCSWLLNPDTIAYLNWKAQLGIQTLLVLYLADTWTPLYAVDYQQGLLVRSNSMADGWMNILARQLVIERDYGKGTFRPDIIEIEPPPWETRTC